MEKGNMPGYKPNPQVITGGTGTGNIQQARRKKDIGQGRKRKKKNVDILRQVGALS